MAIRMVDVSSYQGRPDWAKVAADGVRGAILRVRDSKGADKSFVYNYQACGQHSIARGAYRFSYALTVAQARMEAQEVLRTLDGRKLELGVWLDLEWSRQRALGGPKVRQLARAWMSVIREAGYACNVYCNLDWYKNVCGGLKAEYWIAHYPKNDTGAMVSALRPNVGEIGWQYSRKGRVPGITGDVDLDVWYGELQMIPGTGKPQNPYRDSGKVLKYNRLRAGHQSGSYLLKKLSTYYIIIVYHQRTLREQGDTRPLSVVQNRVVPLSTEGIGSKGEYAEGRCTAWKKHGGRKVWYTRFTLEASGTAMGTESGI